MSSQGAASNEEQNSQQVFLPEIEQWVLPDLRLKGPRGMRHF